MMLMAQEYNASYTAEIGLDLDLDHVALVCQ